MGLKLRFDFQIPLDNGFEGSSDIFNRKKFADSISNIISMAEDSLSLVLDEPWGSGKTYFLRQLNGHLASKGHKVVYFDAFSQDYIDDPFDALVTQLIRALRTAQGVPKNVISDFRQSAASVAKALALSGAKILAHAAMRKFIDEAAIKELSNLKEAIVSESDDLVTAYLERNQKAREGDEDTITAFKEALSKLAAHSDSASECDKTNLVIIIDEIDRCVPPYALKLLERIKHFFATDRVHFIFGASVLQLENSVRAEYGQGIEARNYLLKFFDVILHFPKCHTYPEEPEIIRFIDFLIDTMAFTPRGKEQSYNGVSALKEIAAAKNLSLRTVEKVLAQYNLVYSGSNINHHVGLLCAILSYLKIVEKEKYSKAKLDRLTMEEVVDAIGMAEWANYDEEDRFYKSILYLIDYCTNENPTSIESFVIKDTEMNISLRHLKRGKGFSRLCNELIDTFSIE